MADVRTIFVTFVANTKQLLSGFKKVDKKTSNLTRSFRRLGAALVGAFGARALFRGFSQTIKSTEALTKTAKGIGFTANEYQRLAFTLSEVGVEASSARIAIGDFQKRLSKAVGGSSPQFAKAFKEAGLDIRALSAMGPAQAFNSAFMSLAGQLDDPRIAGLFGNVFEEQSGKDMLKAARQMDKLLQARKDYDRVVGKGLTKKDAQSIEETGRQTRLLGLQWTDFKQKVVIGTLPELNKLLTQLENNGALAKMADDLAKVTAGFAKAAGVLAEFRTALEYEGQAGVSQSRGFGPSLPGESPQHTAERLAREHDARRIPGTNKLGPSVPVPGSRITNQYIDNIFNLNRLSDKDLARKTAQAVEDVQRREAAGQ